LKKNKWKLATSGGCDQYRYAVAKKAITSGKYYFEVKLLETGGCYSAVGFCTNDTFKDSNSTQRLGDDEFGWAMRTYGTHDDLTFSGMKTGGNSIKCFNNWVSNDICGALLDVSKKTITYYRNGEKLDDCVFKKVKGKKFFPVVSICHSNKSVEVNFSAKYPKGVKKGSDDDEESEEKKKWFRFRKR